MTAQAEMKTPSPEDERVLAEEIARAMARRPLMSRLASIQEARAEVASTLDRLEATTIAADDALPPPIPSPSEPPPLPQMSEEEADARFAEVFDETLPPTTPPSSVEWLRRARRERRRERMRQAGGWLATIAIGATIIGTTAMMLQR